ncbi:hypothetical protein QJS04_geneDACA013333 [Acorus gramineus]|uniref:Uncharacterized protein n=1 Tax=Acorus gramineus TaxID=55184 RepID=A0AAV9AA95_ACOGR|nr:hypothetical protein QJS04_geneDACA013333 [Acorus gramineus]
MVMGFGGSGAIEMGEEGGEAAEGVGDLGEREGEEEVGVGGDDAEDASMAMEERVREERERQRWRSFDISGDGGGGTLVRRRESASLVGLSRESRPVVRTVRTLTSHESRTIDGGDERLKKEDKLAALNSEKDSSQDCTIKIWETSQGKLIRELKGHGHWVNSLALNTEYTLRTGAYDHTRKQYSSSEEMKEITVD